MDHPPLRSTFQQYHIIVFKVHFCRMVIFLCDFKCIQYLLFQNVGVVIERNVITTFSPELIM